MASADQGFHGLSSGAPMNARDQNRSTVFSDINGSSMGEIGQNPFRAKKVWDPEKQKYFQAPPSPPDKLKSFGTTSVVGVPPPPPPPPLVEQHSSRVVPKETSEDAEEILSDLRKALTARGAVGLTGLARNFRIVDTNGNKTLNHDELQKCLRLCKVQLDDSDFHTLWSYVDEDGSGQIDYEEFLKAMRGPMPPGRRKLVISVFHALDARSRSSGSGRNDGSLTLDDVRDMYDGKSHPDVQSGKISEGEALLGMLTTFEGKAGNRDGVITLDEWTRYYGDLSTSLENDDHFALTVTSAWPALFDDAQAKKMGFTGALQKPVPQGRVDQLEKILKQAVASRSSASSETQALERAFRNFDTDNSKVVTFDEFVKAMERFGLHASREPGASDVGQCTLAAVRALFDRYDTDGAGSLSYEEFVRGLFPQDAPAHVRASRPTTASSAPAQSTSLALPSDRSADSRPTAVGRSVPVPGTEGTQYQRTYERGGTGMLSGGMNVSLQSQRTAQGSHGRPSGAANGFNKSSGIFR